MMPAAKTSLMGASTVAQLEQEHLSDLGITEKDIDALADQAIEDVCTPGNPRLVTRQDIVDLYKKVL